MLFESVRDVAHHAVGHFKHLRHASVVALEFYYPAAAPPVGEFDDVFDLGAAPRVDALEIVAHRHDVAASACGDVAELENRLSADRPIAIEGASDKKQSDALRSSLTPEETSRRLRELYRLAKTELEESGVNALFLAIGFLKWRPKGANAKDYRAPILLMPVGLTRKNVREGYVLSRLDEDTELNATLVEFLKAEFGVKIDGLDPLPEDDSGVAVAKVLDVFREAVKAFPEWAVEEGAALGNFSFGKFVMWKDLSARADQLSAHPFVAHLMKGGGDYDDGVEVFPPEEVGAHIKYGELFTPLSADSSQLAAVLYSAMGKSFVLHGPPGTGK